MASSKAPGRRRGTENVTVSPALTEADVRNLYDWADLVVVTLKPNRHVSGRTVIFEAVALAVPVVATDAGGLRVYSQTKSSVRPTDDSAALRSAVVRLAEDEKHALT